MRGFSQRLELRQSQTLIMYPQLQQAIKMLQLSNLELTDFVNAEIQQNPLLELQERPFGTDTPVDGAGNAERMTPKAVPEMLTGEFATDQRMVGNRNGERIATARSISAGAEPWHGRNGSFDGEGRPGLDQTATRLRTLREHLLEQIGADLSDQGERVIAWHLLHLLDPAGYLRDGLHAVGTVPGLQYRTGRGCLGTPAATRSGRRLRPRPEGVPGAPIARSEPARSCDPGAA